MLAGEKELPVDACGRQMQLRVARVLLVVARVQRCECVVLLARVVRDLEALEEERDFGLIVHVDALAHPVCGKRRRQNAGYLLDAQEIKEGEWQVALVPNSRKVRPIVVLVHVENLAGSHVPVERQQPEHLLRQMHQLLREALQRLQGAKCQHRVTAWNFAADLEDARDDEAGLARAVANAARHNMQLALEQAMNNAVGVLAGVDERRRPARVNFTRICFC